MEADHNSCHLTALPCLTAYSLKRIHNNQQIDGLSWFVMFSLCFLGMIHFRRQHRNIQIHLFIFIMHHEAASCSFHHPFIHSSINHHLSPIINHHEWPSVITPPSFIIKDHYQKFWKTSTSNNHNLHFKHFYTFLDFFSLHSPNLLLFFPLRAISTKNTKKKARFRFAVRKNPWFSIKSSWFQPVGWKAPRAKAPMECP